MAEIENKVKLEGWSCKLTKETKETLTELQNSGDFATVNQMMETLIERYYSPIKSQDQSAKITELEDLLAKKNEEIKSLNHSLSAVKTDSNTEFEKYKAEFLELTQKCETVILERDQLEQDLIRAKANGELQENEHVISIDPINWKILQFVAEREGKKRNQPWTPVDVINYFIHHRFERGDVNGGFNSVPDSEIKKMKTELNQE
ncbi:MAG: hypothetical protein RBT49_11880 [Bacteroidales bacterium]|jgi:hypothetical protein|nr:hypothetical protein [Bacteroidales bacterium]